jgi:hypothetical protein
MRNKRCHFKAGGRGPQSVCWAEVSITHPLCLMGNSGPMWKFSYTEIDYQSDVCCVSGISQKSKTVL